MQRLRAMPVARRAVLVAAILYGVLLQAFVAAATPALAAEAGILCRHETRGPGSDPGAPRHDHPCCVAAHPGGFGPPPSPTASPVPARRPIVLAVRRPTATTTAGRPPTHAVSARGPPPA